MRLGTRLVRPAAIPTVRPGKFSFRASLRLGGNAITEGTI